MLEPRNESEPARSGGFEFSKPVIVSALYLVGFLNGVTMLIGLVLAYVWRGEPAEEWERSHYTYLIRTFWFGLLGCIVGGVLTIVLIGFALLAIISLWVLARSINALLKAGARQPIPDPDTLFL